jgi:hypothetical protein
MFISQAGLTYFYKWALTCEIQVGKSGICNGCDPGPYTAQGRGWQEGAAGGGGRREEATALLKETIFTIFRMSLLIILWIFGTFFNIYNKPYSPEGIRP